MRFLIIITVILWTVLVNAFIINLQIPQINYRDEIVNYLGDNLWDSDHTSFYSYWFDNGTLREKSYRKYTSFNSWAIRALLEYSISKNDNSTFEEYCLPTVNFLTTFLQDKTNGGFYHWVLENGSQLNMSDWRYNNSVFQIATYQAWALLALIDVYKFTLNTTYIDVYGANVSRFLLNKLWDPFYGGFYAIYLPFYNIYIETYKYSWYEAWLALALMEYYEVTGNTTFMTYANATLDFLTHYLWDNNTGAFIYRSYANGTWESSDRYYLTDQAAALLALVKAVELTGNQSYIDNYFLPALSFAENYLWSAKFQQFFMSYELGAKELDLSIRPSDLSIWLFALVEANQTLKGKNTLIQLLDAAILQMNSNMWDFTHGGFYRKFFINGTLLDSSKWTIEQAIPLFLFTHYLTEFKVDYFTVFLLLGGFAITIGVTIYFHLKFSKNRIFEREKLS